MQPDDVSPLYHLHGPANLTIQGLELSQSIVGVAAWMLAVLRYRPAVVVEIGTERGGMASLLSSCTATYGGELHTLDCRGGGDIAKYPLHGNATFHCWPWQDHVDDIKAWVQRPGLCFLLIDADNARRRQFETFAPMLKSGDVIGLHDVLPDPALCPLVWSWDGGMEVMGTVAQSRLVPFMPEWFDWSGWLVMRK
jgi:hypothetical protein